MNNKKYLLLMLVGLGMFTWSSCAGSSPNNPSDPSSSDFLVFQLIRCNLGIADCTSPTNSENSGGTGGPGTTPATKIILFSSTGTTYQGDMGIGGGNNRTQSDAICTGLKAANYPALTCTNIHVLLSFPAGDDVASFPANFGLDATLPVEGPTSIAIQSDWTTLMSTGAATDLNAAGLGIVGAQYWTGTTASGTLQVNNCSGWTNNNSGTGNAQYGLPNNAGTLWLSWNINGCATLSEIVCACW